MESVAIQRGVYAHSKRHLGPGDDWRQAEMVFPTLGVDKLQYHSSHQAFPHSRQLGPDRIRQLDRPERSAVDFAHLARCGTWWKPRKCFTAGEFGVDSHSAANVARLVGFGGSLDIQLVHRLVEEF